MGPATARHNPQCLRSTYGQVVLSEALMLRQFQGLICVTILPDHHPRNLIVDPCGFRNNPDGAGADIHSSHEMERILRAILKNVLLQPGPNPTLPGLIRPWVGFCGLTVSCYSSGLNPSSRCSACNRPFLQSIL